MKKNTTTTTTKKPKEFTTVTRYKIFEFSDEGHFKHPKQSGWEGDDCVFNEYGYDTIEEAKSAISNRATGLGWGLCEYFIMPVYVAQDKRF